MMKSAARGLVVSSQVAVAGSAHPSPRGASVRGARPPSRDRPGDPPPSPLDVMAAGPSRGAVGPDLGAPAPRAGAPGRPRPRALRKSSLRVAPRVSAVRRRHPRGRDRHRGRARQHPRRRARRRKSHRRAMDPSHRRRARRPRRQGPGASARRPRATTRPRPSPSRTRARPRPGPEPGRQTRFRTHRRHHPETPRLRQPHPRRAVHRQAQTRSTPENRRARGNRSPRRARRSAARPGVAIDRPVVGVHRRSADRSGVALRPAPRRCPPRRAGGGRGHDGRTGVGCPSGGERLVGTAVEGIVDGAFDAGYLVTARVGNNLFRGCLWSEDEPPR